MTTHTPPQPGRVLAGDARDVLQRLDTGTADLAFFSPPYNVGKSYETNVEFDEWNELVEDVIGLTARALKAGGFMAVNMADTSVFADPSIPYWRTVNVERRRADVSADDVAREQLNEPKATTTELADRLGCSRQTIDRRLKGPDARMGIPHPRSRVLDAGILIERWASRAGLYLHDRRIWVKDPAWKSSPWHATSHRAVAEFEHIYILHKPGPTVHERSRLEEQAWTDWGSRGVWQIASVRRNDRHPAEFPAELALRVVALLCAPGNLVIDPFAGTGTTCAAAAALGRRTLGIELNPDWAAAAERRMHAAVDKGWNTEI